MASQYMRRPLRKGDRVRLDPGGPVRVVTRVNDCAAYLAGEAETVAMPDGRTFEAHGAVIAIARWAFVWPEEEECDQKT